MNGGFREIVLSCRVLPACALRVYPDSIASRDVFLTIWALGPDLAVGTGISIFAESLIRISRKFY